MSDKLSSHGDTGMFKMKEGIPVNRSFKRKLAKEVASIEPELLELELRLYVMLTKEEKPYSYDDIFKFYNDLYVKTVKAKVAFYKPKFTIWNLDYMHETYKSRHEERISGNMVHDLAFAEKFGT